MVIKITKQKKTVANQLRKSITLCLTTSLFLVACQSPKLASAVAPPQPALLKNPNQVNSEPLKTNQANVTIAKTLPELAIKLKQKYPQLQNKQNFQTQQTTEQPNAPQPNNVIVSSAPDGQVEISITTQSRLSVVAISGAQYVIFVGDTDGGFDPYVVGGSLLAPVTVKVYWNKTVPSNSFPFIPFPAPDGNYNVLSQGLYIRWDSLDPSAARCYDESRFLYEPYNVYMYRSAYKFFDELPSFIYNEQGEIVETIDRDSICTVNASPILITPFILPFIEPTPTPTPSPTPTPETGPLHLNVPDMWFSPNGDGSKDLASFRVSGAGSWQVQIKANGGVLKTYTGSNSIDLVWDGSESVGEGAYEVILYTTQPTSTQVDSKQLRIDLTPPTIDEPERISTNALDELVFDIEDPKGESLASGIDLASIEVNLSSNYQGFGEPVQKVHSDRDVEVSVALTDKELDLPESPFQLAAVQENFNVKQIAPTTSKVSAKDKAGNPVFKEFDFNASMCLSKQTTDDLIKSYENSLKEIEALLAAIQPDQPMHLLSASNADFSIQGVVKCDSSEDGCDIPIIACSIVDHARELSIHELELLERLKNGALYYETRADYVRTTALVAAQAGLIMALPLAAEFGAVTLALEMNAYFIGLNSFSGRVLAQALVNPQTYRAISKTLDLFADVINTDIKYLKKQPQGTCVTPEVIGHLKGTEENLVNFSGKLADKLNDAASNIIRLGDDFKVANPKMLLKQDGYYYVRDLLSGDQIVGVVHIEKIADTGIIPDPHEIETAIKIASEGKYVRVAPKIQVADLQISDLPTYPNGHIRTTPLGDVEIPTNLAVWDLKASTNAQNIENAFKNQLRDAAKNIQKFFTDKNLPPSIIFDVSKKYTTEEVIAEINRVRQYHLTSDYGQNLLKYNNIVIYTKNGKLNVRANNQFLF